MMSEKKLCRRCLGALIGEDTTFIPNKIIKGGYDDAVITRAKELIISGAMDISFMCDDCERGNCDDCERPSPDDGRYDAWL